jgi:hypothetical protein
MTASTLRRKNMAAPVKTAVLKNEELGMRNKERQHFAIYRHFFAIGKTAGRNIFLSRMIKLYEVKTLILTDRRTLFGCGLPQGL